MMSDNTSRSPQRRSRGANWVRALLIMLGAAVTFFGVIMTIATISIMLDGDIDILILMPFALVTLAGGVALIVTQAKADALKEGTTYPQLDYPIPQPENTSTRNDFRKPTAIGDRPASSDAASEPSASPASSSSSESIEQVAHLVYRSEDLFATLRDLIRHEQRPDSDKYHLATMLEAAGVLNWANAPACEGGRLTRNNHFWIRLKPDDLDAVQYDTLVSAEAALGINQDLPELCRLPLTDSHATHEKLELMRNLVDQDVEKHPLTDEGLRTCYHDIDAAQTPGEWVVRSMVCNAAECVSTPFRVVFDLRSNVEKGICVLSLEIPRPRCMAIFTSDPVQQTGLARAYALRLATLLGRHTLSSSDKVRTLVVNCHEHDSEDTLLSLRLTQSVLKSLIAVARGSMVESAFPTDDSIRTKFDNTGWFAPIEPFMSLNDPEATPTLARRLPELDERLASPAVVATCHAERICDLGINENAARIETWNSVRPHLGNTTEQAVSTLVSARNYASDITVAEACTRCIQALVNGEADLDNLSALAELFVDGAALDRAVARAQVLLDDEGTPDPEAAVKVLETVLAPIEDMGAYLDDETYVYRYFGSVSERIHHNAAVNEGNRKIKLVPDAYFNAHYNASVAYAMLDRKDEALAHADACLRLAPTSTYATMRKVRVLEAQSRIYEAADLIIQALRHAVTPRDAAICHYRLAYMEWKLGREDLAAACYVRSLNWDTEMSSQAREELDDLLSSSPSLSRPSDEDADTLLAREGIPLGCVRSDGEHTLAAAVACIDNGALLSARPLMAAIFAMNNDDVVMGVYRSLDVNI